MSLFREDRLETNHGPLTVASLGEGPPLVLLHGVTRAWQDFLELTPALSTRWGIVAPNFRGHAGSMRVAGGYRAIDYVDDAASVLEQLDRPAVLFGHSLGAMVALAIAARMPEKVRGVILEDPPFETMGARIEQSGLLSYFKQVQQRALRGLNVVELGQALGEIRIEAPLAGAPALFGELRDAAALRWGAKCLAACDPQVLDPIVRGQWVEGYDLRAMLPRVTAPVLLLHADMACGGMLIDEDVSLMRDTLANCIYMRFPGVGHHVHWQDSQATLRVVLPFLESLPI